MMHLKDYSKELQESLIDDREILCNYVMTPEGPKLLDHPILANKYSCEFCKETRHYSPYHDPKISDARLWLCANALCSVYTRRSHKKATTIAPPLKRSQEWALFCEINGIGDVYHDVSFEKIEQSQEKIEYMLKFAKKPSGIVYMQGNPGTGKTYASMGICELFTRTSSSAIFTTQKRMIGEWLDTFKKDYLTNYISRITNCNLLVIDDFGTSEISPGFMSFFMDLINSRMQWKDRGTIITTNLDDKAFSEFCGHALIDRIQTGQKMEFKNKSRRKPKTI